MTRIGKQEERRNRCPRKRKTSFATKTGPKKDNLNLGFREHLNALEDTSVFIAKIK